MAYQRKNRDEHLSNDGLPKRILALDGGGLRGILSLGFLQKIENVLRKRHGDNDDFRLCDYFDLMAGTSTGAIIAALLAMGWRVEEIRDMYMQLGERVFEASWLRQGLFRAKYDQAKLEEELKKTFGPDTVLGGPELKTGLLVMTKRLDTGSPWPISNNPRENILHRGPAARSAMENIRFGGWFGHRRPLRHSSTRKRLKLSKNPTIRR